MFEIAGEWTYSASDLVVALRCEYQLLHRQAEKAGLVSPLAVEADALMARAARLGDTHEERTRADLVAKHGKGQVGRAGGVIEIMRPDVRSLDALLSAHQETLEAMLGGAAVVYQAAFFDGRFHGMADFVCRVDDGNGPLTYAPADTKLSRHARVEALLQLTAYANAIMAMGFPEPERVELWHGDGTQSSHRLADLLPILTDRTARMEELLGHAPAVPAWGQEDLRSCGRCPHCAAAIETRRDVLLVHGVRVDQRQRLVAAGISTIDDLAARADAPVGLSSDTYTKIHAQAALQLEQDATRTDDDPVGTVKAQVWNPAGLLHLPAPSPGDVFFDFEGDPLYEEAGWSSGDRGLEYLFGRVTVDAGSPSYQPLWAHTRLQERVALEEFIDWLVARMATPGFEGLHVYHYAPYEITALKHLVQRHGTRGEELDRLLHGEVFVDLYSTVRRSVRVSERSYSIKKLEPLYMGDELRTGDLTGGADSIVWYAEYADAVRQGDDVTSRARLAGLAGYNEYDCVSTLRLRDWLLDRPELVGAQLPTPEPRLRPDEPEKRRSSRELAEYLVAPFKEVAPADRTEEQQVRALLAAALLFHRRESLPFWWSHFERMAAPMEDWEHNGEMVVLHHEDLIDETPWMPPEGQGRNWRRTLTFLVDLPGSFKLKFPGNVFVFYGGPTPTRAKAADAGDRGYIGAEVLECERRGDRMRLVLLETAAPIDGGAPEPDLPLAVSAKNGPDTETLATAIHEVVTVAFDPEDNCIAQPALDILSRRPPRLRILTPLPAPGDEVSATIAAAVHNLDRSYLAVQGPPGTGKTTKGAEVIRNLVASGWKVGVVAQSHRTVEHMLDAAVRAGTPADRVGKREKGGGDHLGLRLNDAGVLKLATDAGGALIGGTKWDFVNEKRIPRGGLDLLVVDEAGQFALADTIAVSVAAHRLLLLGDPQQLPQVSQARHPAPVEVAALNWLADGAQVLPSKFGYFLEESHRLHPALADACSRLSYEGRLRSTSTAAHRHLEGIEPGVQTHLVHHQGNASRSDEEADVVCSLVDDLVGRAWTDEHGERSLRANDVLVVTPFNAQQNRIRAMLDERGHEEVEVGTVDKFQGREAPVVIVSMASSSGASSPRGASFVFSRNRLNVAISRAQHTAFLVHAIELTDLVPATPAVLGELGAFLGVSQIGRAPASSQAATTGSP